MYLSAEQNYTISRATSQTCQDWVSSGIVIRPTLAIEGSLTHHPTVRYDGERLHAWYWIGSGAQGGRIGHARSDDGIQWVKYSGAVLEPAVGSPTTGVHEPCVLYHADSRSFEMWFSVSRSGLDFYGQGYATSLDGVRWTQRPELLFDDPAAPQQDGPEVVFDEAAGVYHLWYETNEAGYWRIRHATAGWTLPRASFAMSPEPEWLDRGDGAGRFDQVGTSPLAVRFDGTLTRVPGGREPGLSWSLGDGTTADGATVEHVYVLPGFYETTLTATDPQTAEVGRVARRFEVGFRSQALPGWSAQDLGEVSVAGGWSPASGAGDALDLLGAVGTIAGTEDRCRFVYRSGGELPDGDWALEATLHPDFDLAGGMAGLMARGGLETADAMAALVYLHGSSPRLRLLWRQTTGARLEAETLATLAGPIDAATGLRLRLERRGEELRALWSLDAGTTWAERAEPLAFAAPTPFVGVVAAEREAGGERDYALTRIEGLQLLDLSPAAPEFQRGETNGDGKLDLSDAVVTLGYLFVGSGTPPCLDAADANDSGAVDLSDAVYTLGFLFLGSPPPAPFSECGEDPGEDALGCEAPARCE
jgi:hypothetical protein